MKSLIDYLNSLPPLPPHPVLSKHPNPPHPTDIPDLTPERFYFLRCLLYEKDTCQFAGPYRTLTRAKKGDHICARLQIAASFFAEMHYFDYNKAPQGYDPQAQVEWPFEGVDMKKLLLDMRNFSRRVNKLVEEAEDH